MALWASFVRILPTNYGALLLQYVFKLDDRENIAGSGYLEPLAFCCIQPPLGGSHEMHIVSLTAHRKDLVL
jgi:hypothetical protein